MTPKQAGNKLMAMSGLINTAVIQAVRTEQKRTYQLGIAQSSGMHSSAELQSIARARGAGVYSRRRPDRRFAADKANIQSGDLVHGWSVGGAYLDSAGTLHGPVSNTSKDARWFDGQPHGNMMARDIGGAVAKKEEATFVAKISDAIRNALK